MKENHIKKFEVVFEVYGVNDREVYDKVVDWIIEKYLYHYDVEGVDIKRIEEVKE